MPELETHSSPDELPDTAVLEDLVQAGADREQSPLMQDGTQTTATTADGGRGGLGCPSEHQGSANTSGAAPSPSIILDTACSSSAYALEKATSSIYNGSCDAAVVVGSSLLLNPLYSSMLQLVNAISQRGSCSSFDEAADGYLRSEAVAAIFLQKSDVAYRHYAEIVAIGTNTDGHKTTSISHPSREMQLRLFEETYRSAAIDPASVDYIEAHGTGTKGR
ncbi:fatty acid synthase-like [Schistocerca americana]|uniref:fatty acid synthase-like n=1 Tax=Schistocerca americana TaxID=7009 RepID=UPI001F4FB585|nr:fatty acid synthase-like [Schistocerca americana]